MCTKSPQALTQFIDMLVQEEREVVDDFYCIVRVILRPLKKVLLPAKDEKKNPSCAVDLQSAAQTLMSMNECV